MNSKLKKKIIVGIFSTGLLLVAWQLYLPSSLTQKTATAYAVKKGLGYNDIAKDLEKRGIIKNQWFFNTYVVLSGNYGKLQAGNYSISPSMSVASIIKKFTTGEVIKNTVTIVEGWDLEDIADYLQEKKIYTRQEFLDVAKKDANPLFLALGDKPEGASLEGYLFPDTYQMHADEKPEDLVQNMLFNFEGKLTPELRKEIEAQNKSVFEIITMASILEKEVKNLEDKKIVAGILWKRLESNMPLQVDATINYITGRSDRSVAIKDTKVNSPYNTYKYQGLPKGPISNPGMDSILAAIYPKDNPYWFYLSAARTGKTIFSKTLDEHNAAVVKYLKS